MQDEQRRIRFSTSETEMKEVRAKLLDYLDYLMNSIVKIFEEPMFTYSLKFMNVDGRIE